VQELSVNKNGKRYRVLFIGLNRAPPHREAWSKTINEWSMFLRGVVLTTGRVRPIIKRYKNYIIIDSKIGYFLLPLYSVILQHFFDLIIVEQRPDDLYGILISFLFFSKILKADKCCYRFTIEWMKDKFYNGLGMRIFFKYVLPNLKFVFAFDKQTEHYLCKVINQKRVHFIAGLNLPEYQELQAHSNSNFRIMFASSPLHSNCDAFKEKGVDIILEALRNITSSPCKKTNFRLVILWRTSARYLMRWLSELNLEDYVDLYLGYVDINYLLRNSHVLVFTPRSLVESAHYPRSIIESLAAGRPVIVTDNLEISSIIEREKCGIVIKPSAHDLAEAIKQILIDYEKYQRNCRRTAEEFFDLKKNLLQVFSENV
jgi:glycosyltransferase involved in cell wall biosynthesis